MRLLDETDFDVARTRAQRLQIDPFRRVGAGPSEIPSQTQSVSASRPNAPEWVPDSPAQSACILATSHLDQTDKEG